LWSRREHPSGDGGNTCGLDGNMLRVTIVDIKKPHFTGDSTQIYNEKGSHYGLQKKAGNRKGNHFFKPVLYYLKELFVM